MKLITRFMTAHEVVPIIAASLLSAGPVQADDVQAAKPFSVQVQGTGRPIILIPGLSCGGNVWDGTVAHFRGRFECHVVTLAGFAGQPAIEGPFLQKVRDGLIQYIQEKKLERPVIVGHSLGGTMAIWIAAAAPGLTGPIVAVDGVPFLPALLQAGASVESVRQQAESMRKLYESQTPAQFALQNRLTLASMITDAKHIEKVSQQSARSDPQAVAWAMYELMTTDLRPHLKAVRSPLLLIGATAAVTDPERRKQSEQNYREQVADAPRHKVVFAPKAKHFIQLDEPDFFYQEVEQFLTAHEGQ